MICYILPNVVFLLYLRQNIRIMSTIIGRRSEVEELEKLYRSERPEFVAVYGRRRVGKTFLIKQALKGRITFQHTGVHAAAALQLRPPSLVYSRTFADLTLPFSSYS